MIAFFPTFYPDELVYSLVCRYHVRAGYAKSIMTISDVYRRRVLSPSIEFINELTDEANEWICKDSNYEDIIREHTMFGFYAHFLSSEKKKTIMRQLEAFPSNWRVLLSVPTIIDKCLQYCPLCAEEDRKEYGEAYWHRSHQLPRIAVCPKHLCRLSKTEIKMVSNKYCGFRDAESVIPKDRVTVLNMNKNENDLARYMFDVMGSDIYYEEAIPLRVLFQNHIDARYLSNTGMVKDIEQLYIEYENFYKGLPIQTMREFQKNFNLRCVDAYFICQIAMLEGIRVQELTNPPKGIRLNDINTLYDALSEKYGVPSDTVAMIARNIMIYYKERNSVIQNSSKPYFKICEL